MGAVAYERWPFLRGSNNKALTGEILVFLISGPYGSWLLTGGGRTQRFNC